MASCELCCHGSAQSPKPVHDRNPHVRFRCWAGHLVPDRGGLRGDYAGKENVPVWKLPLLRLAVLLLDRPGGRDFLVAAYDGACLVGVLFAEGFRFRLHGSEVAGSMGLADGAPGVSQGRSRPSPLLQETRRRHCDRGAGVLPGVHHRRPKGPAFRFWNACCQAFPDDISITGRVGLWVRLLDPLSRRRVERTPRRTHQRLACSVGFSMPAGRIPLRWMAFVLIIPATWCLPEFDAGTGGTRRSRVSLDSAASGAAGRNTVTSRGPWWPSRGGRGSGLRQLLPPGLPGSRHAGRGGDRSARPRRAHVAGCHWIVGPPSPR